VADDHKTGMESVKIAGVSLGSPGECGSTVTCGWVVFTGNQDGTTGGGVEWTGWWGDGSIRYWGGLHGKSKEEESDWFFRG